MSQIKSITHTDKIWWIRVSPTTESIEKIHNILIKFSGHYGLDYYDDDKGAHYLEKRYKFWKNVDKIILPEDEAGYLIFTETHINIVLRKESKLFTKLRNEFSKEFPFDDTKYIKEAERLAKLERKTKNKK